MFIDPGDKHFNAPAVRGEDESLDAEKETHAHVFFPLLMPGNFSRRREKMTFLGCTLRGVTAPSRPIAEFVGPNFGCSRAVKMEIFFQGRFGGVYVFSGN